MNNNNNNKISAKILKEIKTRVYTPAAMNLAPRRRESVSQVCDKRAIWILQAAIPAGERGRQKDPPLRRV